MTKNRNGVDPTPPIYCYKCSGEHGDKTMTYKDDFDGLYGCMKAWGSKIKRLTKDSSVRYECIDCEYSQMYPKWYIEEWTIK